MKPPQPPRRSSGHRFTVNGPVPEVRRFPNFRSQLNRNSDKRRQLKCVHLSVKIYSVCTSLYQTRHRARTSTRWHFAFGAMMSYQRNPCTDCKSAQKCTTRGHPIPFPQVTSGSMQ